MFSTDFIFRQQENLQQENLVVNQKCQAGFTLCNKILFPMFYKAGEKFGETSVVMRLDAKTGLL